MQVLYVRPKFVRRSLCLAVVAIFLISIGGRILVLADSSIDSSWSSPSAASVRRISNLPNIQNQPNLFSNLDCTPISYRMVGSHIMQKGCFTPTSFGMLESSQQVIIFNGTDEGLPLTAYSAHQILAPWPNALNLVALDAASFGGSYISIYKNPLALLQDQRNFTGQLTGKKLTGPPEIHLKDLSGQKIRVNSQTLAFSSDGGWLVAETLHGSFVRVNLATLDIVPFAQSFGSLGSPGLLQSQVAVSDNGRFVAINNLSAASFKVYDLSTCIGAVNNLQPQNCKSYNYWPLVTKQISELQSLRHLRFLNDKLLSFEATSINTTASGVYGLAPVANITSLIDYLGLGDSYTSGEGAFDYLTGTDTPNNKCHLSSKSYPLLLTQDLFSSSGGRSVACSGAVINDIGSMAASYRGQVKNGVSFGELSQSSTFDTLMANFSAGHIPQRHFVKHYQPRVFTVSIGGNDIGFGSILQQCVMPRISISGNASTCYSSYESRAEVAQLIDRTVPRWAALYRQLAADSPGGQLYAIGYPSIASSTGKCGQNVNLNKSELEFAEELLHYLNDSIRQAATAAGVPYVDISQALAGHRLCEASGYNVALNGLTSGNDGGLFGLNVIGRESYHPNALGHELIEQAILKKTDNLTLRGSSTAPTHTGQNLLNAPKSGRDIYHLSSQSITSPVLRKGINAAIKSEGAGSGLKPNSNYSIRLDGPGGISLGSVTSTNLGDITASVMVPADTSSGGHTVDIIGPGQTGKSIDIIQPVFISGNESDADEDGQPNSSDSCVYSLNSGEDMDGDGTDDVCDNIIGSAPVIIQPDRSAASLSAENSSTTFKHLVSQPLLRAQQLPVSAASGKKQKASDISANGSVSPLRASTMTVLSSPSPAAALSNKKIPATSNKVLAKVNSRQDTRSLKAKARSLSRGVSEQTALRNLSLGLLCFTIMTISVIALVVLYKKLKGKRQC